MAARVSKDNLFDNHEEIVAVLYDKKTITDPDVVAFLIKEKKEFQPISRAMCRMLGRMDFGEKWSKYAEELPVIFRLDWNEYLTSRNKS